MSDITKLINDLKSDDESVRSFAVDDLRQINSEDAVQPLVDLLLSERSVIIRESIFKTFSQIKGKKTIDALIFLLRSDEAFIRNQAITVLNEKGEESLESLRALLKDPDKDVRKLALDALFSFEHPESAKIIVEAFTDQAINVRITAVEYIGRLEAKEFSDDIVNVLKSSENILLTCSCLESLSIIGSSENMEEIKKIFSDVNKIDPMIMFSYVKVIGSLGDLDSYDMLTGILKNFGTVISKEIIQSVQKISRRLKNKELPTELLNSFIVILNDLDEMGQYSILNMISAYNNDEVYNILLEKLNSNKRMVKLGAIEGLGKLGNSKAIEILEDLLEIEEDEELQEVLNDSIETLKE